MIRSIRWFRRFGSLRRLDLGDVLVVGVVVVVIVVAGPHGPREDQDRERDQDREQCAHATPDPQPTEPVYRVSKKAIRSAVWPSLSFAVSAMPWTAPRSRRSASSVAALPSWKYGALAATPIRLGVSANGSVEPLNLWVVESE